MASSGSSAPAVIEAAFAADFAAAAGVDLVVAPTTPTSGPTTSSPDERPATGVEGNAVQSTSGGMAWTASRGRLHRLLRVTPLDPFAYHDAAVQTDSAIFIRTFIAGASGSAGWQDCGPPSSLRWWMSRTQCFWGDDRLRDGRG